MTDDSHREWYTLNPTTSRLLPGARVFVTTSGVAELERARSFGCLAATVERVERDGRSRVIHTDRGPVRSAPAAEWTVACAHCGDRAIEASDGGVDGRCWAHGGISSYHRGLPECNATRAANGLEPWPIPVKVAERLAERDRAAAAPAPVDLTAADVPACGHRGTPDDCCSRCADRWMAPAEPVESPAAEPVQLALDLDDASPDVVVIPCGGAKLDHAAPAGQLYTGSYHRACRAAADALGARRVLILSALHGLVELDAVLAPYELRMGQPGSVTAAQLAEQAERLGVAGARSVVALAGQTYTEPLRAVWPTLVEPLAGSRGIGDQLGRMARIRTTGAL